MASTSNKIYQVAVVIFENADLLDFAGPIEMLSAVHYGKDWSNPVFNITTIGESAAIKSRGLEVKVDLTITQALERLDTFDVLQIPGGRPELIMGMIKQDGALLQFCKKFAEQKHEDGKENRVIFSVCTGALLLAATGALRDLKVTTHHWAYDLLPRIEPTATVINTYADSKSGRYVDGGLNSNGIRILTAGGVTCGLDAALYLGELKAGKEAAEAVAEVTEHGWKRVAPACDCHV